MDKLVPFSISYRSFLGGFLFREIILAYCQHIDNLNCFWLVLDSALAQVNFKNTLFQTL